MKQIDITSILSQDLISRPAAHDLLDYCIAVHEGNIIIDFSNVKFATRSFIDEFYNLFLKNSTALPFKLNLEHLPEDINIMISSVSRTQYRTHVIAPTQNRIDFNSVEDLFAYIDKISV